VPRERPAAQQVQLVRGHVLRANARISPRGRASWEPGQPRRRSVQPMDRAHGARNKRRSSHDKLKFKVLKNLMERIALKAETVEQGGCACSGAPRGGRRRGGGGPHHDVLPQVEGPDAVRVEAAPGAVLRRPEAPLAAGARQGRACAERAAQQRSPGPLRPPPETRVAASRLHAHPCLPRQRARHARPTRRLVRCPGAGTHT